MLIHRVVRSTDRRFSKSKKSGAIGAVFVFAAAVAARSHRDLWPAKRRQRTGTLFLAGHDCFQGWIQDDVDDSPAFEDPSGRGACTASDFAGHSIMADTAGGHGIEGRPPCLLRTAAGIGVIGQAVVGVLSTRLAAVVTDDPCTGRCKPEREF
ncbi:MAG TPA: hypothetical protein VN043_16310 [Rhodanobacter sp.]|nr:hypothetical protein [Rhodanobacter sp.]